MAENKKLAGRPKGSKNTFSKEQIEQLQARVNELEKEKNSYNDVVDEFVDGFIMELSQNIKSIDMDVLQKWFSSPDSYINEISDLLTYYYIIDGNVSQLYDIIFSLPELNYKIKTSKKLGSYENDMASIKEALERKVKHKGLTRELLVQLAHDGSVLGTWLGNKSEPYFNVFSNLNYIYPYGIYKGQMVGVFDLSYLDTLTEEQRLVIYNNLNPLITKRIYEKYKSCSDYNKKAELQLVVLPPEKSLVARTRILNRNQRLGIPYGTQAIFDIQHKQKMKDLERAIADKIIRAIAIVKFKDKDENDNKVKESTQKKVFKKVKTALEKNNNAKGGLTCLAMPSFADFSFPEIKNGDDIFKSDKYDSVNNDITTSTVSPVLSNGTGGNYASANLNLEMVYKKIGTMLESIEEIYNQLILITLGTNKGKYYTFEYDKGMPLSKSDKLKTLTNLQSQGYSTKAVLDLIGIDSEEYFEQSIYEIEKLDLRNKIMPPLTSYTTSGKGDSGSPTVENPTNDSTIVSTENGANEQPKTK